MLYDAYEGYMRMSSPAVAHEPACPISRADYRRWVEQQPRGRFERVNGVVVAMAPERAGHNNRKMLAWLALRRAVQESGLACHVYGDGMTVEVGDSDYEPDVVMHCGPGLADDATAVPDPLLIVEVLSPSTSGSDRTWKLQEYFRLPSLRHYLIIWADRQQIAQHWRNDDGVVETRLISDGRISLDPPGITIAVEDVYGS